MTRSVPVPDAFIALLDEVHDVGRTQQSGGHDHGPIWPVSRNTTYDRVGRVMQGSASAERRMPRPRASAMAFSFMPSAAASFCRGRRNGWAIPIRAISPHYVEQLARLAPNEVGDERDDASLMW